jgi:hypothetical protein
LPVLPVFAGAVDLGFLRPLVATAQQQNDLRSSYGVVNAVARTQIDGQLPYAIPAETMVAKIAEFQPIHAPVDGDSGFCVSKPPMLLQEHVFPVRGEVMARSVSPPRKRESRLMSMGSMSETLSHNPTPLQPVGRSHGAESATRHTAKSGPGCPLKALAGATVSRIQPSLFQAFVPGHRFGIIPAPGSFGQSFSTGQDDSSTAGPSIARIARGRDPLRSGGPFFFFS